MLSKAFWYILLDAAYFRYLNQTGEFLIEGLSVHHRHESHVTYPHYNYKTEDGIKTANRFNPVNTNAFQRTLLHYHYSRVRDARLSKGICVFDSPIKDLFPMPLGRYKLILTSRHVARNMARLSREKPLLKNNMKDADR